MEAAIAFVVVYAVVLYLPITLSAYRFMVLAGYDDCWRAFVPLWNFFILFDLASISRLAVLLPIFPVLPIVAGRIAKRTGAPQWVGWIAGMPLIHIVGLPTLAFASSQLLHPDPETPDLLTLDLLKQRAREMLDEGATKSYVVMHLGMNGLRKRRAEELVNELSRIKAA